MQLWDTPARYGTVTRVLHWGIAVLIIVQFLGMALKIMLGRESAVAGLFVRNHQPLGTILFLLILARVVWMIMNRNNRPAYDAGVIGYLAKLGHFALYALMVVVPVAALARAWGGERAFAPFGFEIFAARPETEVVGPAVAFGNNFHGELAWVMGVLILGHIAMALFHQFVLRDRLFRRIIH